MGRIQYWRDTVHERRDSGLKKFRTRGIQEMRDTGIRSGTRFYALYVYCVSYKKMSQIFKQIKKFMTHTL